MTEENIKTIDLTPTWEEIMPGVLDAYAQTYVGGDGDGAVTHEVLERIDKRTSLSAALLDMAKAADLLNDALAWYAQKGMAFEKPSDPMPEWVIEAAALKEDAA